MREERRERERESLPKQEARISGDEPEMLETSECGSRKQDVCLQLGHISAECAPSVSEIRVKTGRDNERDRESTRYKPEMRLSTRPKRFLILQHVG